MNIKEIKKIIDLAESTNIHELEVKEGEFTVRVVKHPTHHHVAHTLPLQTPISVSPSLDTAEPASTPPKATLTGHLIRSPMVGTFYAAASPDAPPFVTIGQSIQAGDVLCIIEAMKMFNEIDADKGGRIVDILLKNGDPVEYDQPLFIIE